MRVLHVLGERGFSGGEVQLRHVLAHMEAEGHESHLVLHPDARFQAAAAQLDLPVRNVSMSMNLSFPAARAIRRAIRSVEPDVLHLADSRGHKLGAIGTMLGRRPPVVVTRRISKRIRRGPYNRWLYVHVPRAVIAVSRAVEADLLARGVPPERIHVVPDGVDERRYEDLVDRGLHVRAKLSIPRNAPVIASAARLDPKKGQVHLLRALSGLPAAWLLLAGEGPERRVLEREARELGLEERVRMPGQMDTRDVLGTADIAGAPSLQEGFGVFALEAQAAGVPVVAFRTGGLAECVQDGVTGILVDPGDGEGLTAAIGRLIEDERLRGRLGESGRARVLESFRASDMAAKTVAVYAASATSA